MRKIISLILILSMIFTISPFVFADDMMYCRFCGKQISADSIFCQFCGKQVGGDGNNVSAPSAPAPVQAASIDYDELAKKVLRIENYEDGELVSRGSGVIVFDSNIIVTNYHVISDFCETIRVVADNGETAEVNSILIFDDGDDLAILKLDAPTSITPFVIGDSENLKRGDEVLAIGSPLGLLNTVSNGIISGIIDYGGYKDIQTTAPISHGSSGGALLNKSGELIGITYAGSEEGENLGFAIPVSEVEELWTRYQNMPEAEKSAYINGVKNLREGSYMEAKEIFEQLGCEDLINYSKYLQALQYADNESFDKAISLFSELERIEYKDSADKKMDIQALKAVSLMKKKALGEMDRGITILESLKKSGYEGADELLETAYSILWDWSIEQFQAQKYGTAAPGFSRLARVNRYSSDAQLYAAISFALNGYGSSLTYSDYELLRDNINLPDVKIAIMADGEMALRFLDGKWRTTNGYKYDYSMKERHFDWTLPCVSYAVGNVKIENGIEYFKDSGSEIWKEDRAIKIIDANTIEIYCYANNTTYTLYRQ